MYLLLKYPAGVIVEGVLLAHGPNRLRVAAAGFTDAAELIRSGARWLDSHGEPVELEFLMSDTNDARNLDLPVRASALRGSGAGAAGL